MRDSPISNDNSTGWVGERRREPRKRVLLQGKIVYPHNNFSSDCLIRDLSPGGARIAIDGRAVCLDPFLIVVRDAVAHESTTMWSDPRQAGLRFDRSHALGDDVPLQLRAIQRLWVNLMPR